MVVSDHAKASRIQTAFYFVVLVQPSYPIHSTTTHLYDFYIVGVDVLHCRCALRASIFFSHPPGHRERVPAGRWHPPISGSIPRRRRWVFFLLYILCFFYSLKVVFNVVRKLVLCVLRCSFALLPRSLPKSRPLTAVKCHRIRACVSVFIFKFFICHFPSINRFLGGQELHF